MTRKRSKTAAGERPEALREALERATDAFMDPCSWSDRMCEAMTRDFGWARSVNEYQDVYRRALARRAERVSLP